jgi:hypothetical protein
MCVSSHLFTNWFCVCNVLVIWSQIGSICESIKSFDHKLVLCVYHLHTNWFCVFLVIRSQIGCLCVKSTKSFDHKSVLCMYQVIWSQIGSVCVKSIKPFNHKLVLWVCNKSFGHNLVLCL